MGLGYRARDLNDLPSLEVKVLIEYTGRLDAEGSKSGDSIMQTTHFGYRNLACLLSIYQESHEGPPHRSAGIFQ